MSDLARRPVARGLAPGRLVALALAALLVAGVVVFVARRGGPPAPVPRAAAPDRARPLAGRPPLIVEPVPGSEGLSGAPLRRFLERATHKRPRDAGRWLALGAVEANTGDLGAARRALTQAGRLGSPGAAVALAVAAYEPRRPQATVVALTRLAASSGGSFARYERGVVELWAGRVDSASTTLRTLRDAGPESFYGVRADDLLHPGMQQGYPPFVPDAEPTATSVAALEAATRTRATDPAAWLQYGAALQVGGQRQRALAAYRRAFALAPEDVEAQVAVAVGAFSKDHPERAFGTLGPLVRDRATDPVPRFHLGLLLLWIGERSQGLAELSQVARAAPQSRLGRLAKAFAAGG